MFSSDPTDSVPRASVKGGDLGWWRTHNKNRRVTLTHLKVATNNHLRTDRRTAVMQVHWTRHLTSESQLTATRLDPNPGHMPFHGVSILLCDHLNPLLLLSNPLLLRTHGPGITARHSFSAHLSCRHQRDTQDSQDCSTRQQQLAQRTTRQESHANCKNGSIGTGSYTTHHVAIWPARFH